LDDGISTSRISDIRNPLPVGISIRGLGNNLKLTVGSIILHGEAGLEETQADGVDCTVNRPEPETHDAD
jgi:hypothetical protein